MREYYILGANIVKIDNYRILEQLDSLNLVSGLKINTYLSGLNLTVVEISDNGNRISLLMNY